MGLFDDIVSQAKVFIDGPMGNFQLARVENLNVTDQQKVEVKTSLGIEGGSGLQYQTGGGEISMTVFREQGNPEVDWRKARILKTRFAITIQDTGGQRMQFFCAVSSVDRKDDDKGSHMDDVKLVYTRFKVLPPSI